jgi:hypothetical protein
MYLRVVKSKVRIVHHQTKWVALTGAKLPDSSEWASERDLTRFTDPNQPYFWPPE